MKSWSVELSKVRLTNKGEGPMKAQFLIDFLVELPQIDAKHEWWILTLMDLPTKKVVKWNHT